MFYVDFSFLKDNKKAVNLIPCSVPEALQNPYYLTRKLTVP